MKKRVISLLCAIVLTLAVAGIAFAAGPESEVMPCFNTKRYTVIIKDAPIYWNIDDLDKVKCTFKPGSNVFVQYTIENGRYAYVTFSETDGYTNGYIEMSNIRLSAHCFRVTVNDAGLYRSPDDLTIADGYMKVGDFVLTPNLPKLGRGLYIYVEVLTGRVKEALGKNAYGYVSDYMISET